MLGFVFSSLILCMFYLQPNLQCKTLKEGAESEQFWQLLGEKAEYPSQKIARESESDPHLFSCHFSKGLHYKYLLLFDYTLSNSIILSSTISHSLTGSVFLLFIHGGSIAADLAGVLKVCKFCWLLKFIIANSNSEVMHQWWP